MSAVLLNLKDHKSRQTKCRWTGGRERGQCVNKSGHFANHLIFAKEHIPLGGERMENNRMISTLLASPLDIFHFFYRFFFFQILHHDTSLFIDCMKSGQVLVHDVFIHGHHCHQLLLLFLGYLQWATPCTKCFTYIIECILHGNSTRWVILSHLF